MSSSERLRIRTKLGFGIGSIGEAAIYIAFNTWNFLFYNQVLGLSGTLAGLAVTISVFFDGVADPFVGSLSDRWRSKLGRRHPFLYAAPIPLALTFYLLYAPPEGLTGISLFLWFTTFATLHRLAMTVYQVPHLALGAELSKDYHQRSIIMSYATMFMVVGGASTYFYGWTWFSKIPGGTSVRDGYAGMAAGVALISSLSILLSAHFTRDQIPHLVQPPPPKEPLSLGQLWREIQDCLSNRNYRMLLLGLFFVSASTGTRETVTSYTNLFFWELPEEKIRVFGLASPPAYLLAFILTWRFHRAFDKRNTLVYALVLLTAASTLPVCLRLMGLMPANGSSALVGVLSLFTLFFYFGLAIMMISALSALADIADEHELNTGRRQEGMFYAARTLFGKLSSGFGHIVAGAAIDLIHFPTGAKPGQVAEDIVIKLGLIDGPIGALPSLIGIYFYAQYRINRQQHTEIQRALRERHPAPSPAPASPLPGAPGVESAAPG